MGFFTWEDTVMGLSALAMQAATLLAEQNLPAALQAAQRCLQAEPGNAPMWNLLGVCAARLGQGDLALQCWQQALRLDAAAADVHYNLGCLHDERGEAALAEQYFLAELAADPQHQDSLYRLALRYQQDGRVAQEEACWRRLLRVQPDHVVALHDLLLLCQRQRRWRVAARLLQRALRLPQLTSAEAAALAAACLQQGMASAAMRLLQHNVPLEQADASQAAIWALACSELRQAGRAEAAWRQAVASQPQQPRHVQNLGYLLLVQRRWHEGWQAHEARLLRPPVELGLPSLASPRWQGEPLAGKHLLVWLEQGLGDALQFCRYLPQLQAERLTVVCRPELIRLLHSMALGCPALFLSLTSLDMALPAHDCHVFSMSLPGLLQPDPAATPPAGFTLPPSPRLPARQRKLRLGLVWRGHARHPFDHHRSLPALRLLTPLLQLPHIEWLSLQLPVNATEQTWLGQWPQLLAGEDGLADLADTAGVLAQLDGLVTVDTALAHLAGCLGLPCWLLLSASHTDWRWGWEGESTPWYPALRLYRQQQAGDWPGLLARLAADLAALA
ncbi:tetratricopeptide repeat protein [Aquitalea aquatilis]|uniref:tetratricopeptide repeat protein n=1 Tax=Aquitalea aquatilis TaxID=1537400 RepID=UPI0010BDB0EF|nr:tetratricopeptide repeat protein [Aquitalea aquatilis]